MSIVSLLPVTLTNGQIADATQVMADLNQIVNNVNANAAALNGSNAFLGGTTQTIGGDVIVTATATQTLTNKNLLGFVPVIDTVAGIRALLITGNPKIFVTGYYAAHDGGGGLYSYDSSDTTSADNGGTIIVATDGGRWKLSYTTYVSLKQFGAKVDGSTNDSTAWANWNTAAVSGYLPTGTTLTNVVITSPFVLVGDGARKSIIMPFSNTTAALTYNPTSPGPYWTYSSLVEGIDFTTNGASQTGVGFTFGATTQAAYVAGMEFANNVTFRNCQWYNMLKGVQFPFGNIGSEFHSCGWNNNYYGVYSIDNKQYPAVSGSAAMHAGNKYFYGGQFGSNVCGIYVHNATLGFGGISTYGTIFENNNIDHYLYSTNASIVPSFNDCWREGSGALVSASTVAIDAWTGSVVSTYNAPPHVMIFDGSGCTYNVVGGFFGDCYIRATGTRVIARGCHVESTPGFGAYPCQVDAADSAIFMYDPETSGGIPIAARCFVRGIVKPVNSTINTTNTFSRQAWAAHRYNKLAGSYGAGFASAASQVINLTALSAMTGVGIAAPTNTTVSDGVIYATCNQYAAAFTTTGQSAYLTAAVTAAPAGWYVVTFDVKATAGDPYFVLFDGSNTLMSALAVPELNVWYTAMALGNYGGSGSLYLQMQSVTGISCTARISAYQRIRFDTEHEAQAFIESGVYVGP